MLVLLLWFWLLSAVAPLLCCHRRRTSRGRPYVAASIALSRARKPDWVVEEIVRLKALMDEAGCRRLADTFNRMHAVRRRMTVSKSWVATTVRVRRLEIEDRRRHWKRRVPQPMGVNLIWGLDLAGKMDRGGNVHPILGIVDHGSRFAVALRALKDKSAITVLRALLDAIERHGRPRIIRTDNDGAFSSTLFRIVLAALGIRPQRTEPHCPWQNGRIERFFGTLKNKLDRWMVSSSGELELALGDFRSWYNHVRPHQHLQGRTPFEAWRAIDPYATPPNQMRYFSAWEGILTGYWLRR